MKFLWPLGGGTRNGPRFALVAALVVAACGGETRKANQSPEDTDTGLTEQLGDGMSSPPSRNDYDLFVDEWSRCYSLLPDWARCSFSDGLRLSPSHPCSNSEGETAPLEAAKRDVEECARDADYQGHICVIARHDDNGRVFGATVEAGDPRVENCVRGVVEQIAMPSSPPFLELRRWATHHLYWVPKDEPATAAPLEPWQLNIVFESMSQRARGCAADPGGGRALVKIVVERTGTVVKATVDEDNHRPSDAQCVEAIVLGTAFPSWSDGPSRMLVHARL